MCAYLYVGPVRCIGYKNSAVGDVWFRLGCIWNPSIPNPSPPQVDSRAPPMRALAINVRPSVSNGVLQSRCRARRHYGTHVCLKQPASGCVCVPRWDAVIVRAVLLRAPTCEQDAEAGAGPFAGPALPVAGAEHSCTVYGWAAPCSLQGKVA